VDGAVAVGVQVRRRDAAKTLKLSDETSPDDAARFWRFPAALAPQFSLARQGLRKGVRK